MAFEGNKRKLKTVVNDEANFYSLNYLRHKFKKTMDLEIIDVRQELLAHNERQINVDWFGVIVQSRSFTQNGERASDGSDGEDPKEKSIQNHCNEPPVLIFL